MESEPTVLNIEERMQKMLLGMNAMLSLSQYCETLIEEEKAKAQPAKDAVSELLSALGLDDELLIERFLEEFTKSGIAGEA